MPEVQVHPRLMEFFDARHTSSATQSGARLCAHARGGGFSVVPIEAAWQTAIGPPVVLAIGPEGGWIDRELETFAERGFALVSLGDAVLRVEAALAAALGQIGLLLRAAA
jgi:RsmE family RNA methyltransferase